MKKRKETRKDQLKGLESRVYIRVQLSLNITLIFHFIFTFFRSFSYVEIVRHMHTDTVHLQRLIHIQSDPIVLVN